MFRVADACFNICREPAARRSGKLPTLPARAVTTLGELASMKQAKEGTFGEKM